MKHLVVLISFTFTLISHCQTWQELSGVNDDDNFFDMQHKANAFFEANPGQMGTTTFSGHVFDSNYKRFKRWEYYWQYRVEDDGRFPQRNWQSIKDDISIARADHDGQRAAWVNINQTVPGTSTGYDGMGRTTSIAFHPTDPNTYIVSAAIGGLWLTTNHGNTYTSIGDDLPYLAVSDVAYDQQNTNTIYAATGDAIWYGLPSLGLLKSTDLGQTWSTTGLSYNLNDNIRIHKILVNPNDGQTIFACDNNGLQRSSDGGATWSTVNNGFHWDVVYRPGSTDTLYALAESSGDLEIFLSSDGGINFTQISNLNESNSSYNTSFLSVTPADPDVIYCLNGNQDVLFKSDDAGLTFTLENSSTPGDDGMVVSRSNANRVYVGALNNYRSDDSGSSFSQKSNWWDDGNYTPVHADTRRMLTNPLHPNRIYVCNDGGIYYYDELSDNWTEKSAGLIITQYYSVATSQTNVERVSGGSQDNGTRIRNNNGTWRNLNEGDGMEVAIDNVDQNLVYCTYVNGQLYRSYDAWVNDIYTEITPQDGGNTVSGNWVTPYVLDPSNNSVIVAGYDDVYRSTNEGNSWTKISNNVAGGNLTDVAVSPLDQDYIYTSRSNVMYYTEDGGTNWNIRPVTTSKSILSLAPSPYDKETICVSLSGYTSSQKVFLTTDNGLSWTNISTGLPNVPVNKIIYQNGGNGLMYAGTDLGFYFYDGSTWQAMNQGLPLTQVSDIALQYAAGKIRIGTHGRGIYETDMLDPLVSVENDLDVNFKLYPNPSSEKKVMIELYNMLGEGNFKIIDIQGKVQSTGLVRNGANAVSLENCSKGVYIVEIKIDNNILVKKLVLD